MLTRPQVLLLTALLLAGLAILLAYPILSRRIMPDRRRLRARWPRRVIARLRRVLTLGSADAPHALLHRHGMELLETLLHLRSELRGLPPLPAVHGALRVQSAADAVAQERILPTRESLFQTLDEECPSSELSTSERVGFPLIVGAALVHHLDALLRAMIATHREQEKIAVTGRRVLRAKRPVALLSSSQLSLAALAALIQHARAQDSHGLQLILDEWLTQRGLHAEDVLMQQARRSVAIAQELQRIMDSLSVIRRTDWSDAAENTDPLHQLLLTDPAGVYPRMTLASRTALRQRVEAVARRMHTSAYSVAEAALQLSRDAEPQSQETHVGFWLHRARELAALQSQLNTHRGTLWLLGQRFPVTLRRALLWGASAAVTLPYLNAGGPLTLLPTFYIVAGCLIRSMLRRAEKPVAPPAVSISPEDDTLRTLLVLPTQTADPASALHALRFLWTAQHACGQLPVDCLIAADHAPRLTQRSAGDSDVHQTLFNGVSALQAEMKQGSVMYLQRSRQWSPVHQQYAARGGRAGCIETVCRLISQGECEDTFDFLTFQPSRLYRRYAFVMVLDGSALPAPGMLEALLKAASHPLNMRYPSPTGMQGFSCFAPVGRSKGADRAATGLRLIRPDAYLEALDGALIPDDNEQNDFLRDALSGLCTVPAAQAMTAAPRPPHDLAEESFHTQLARWRSAGWLLPLVETPSGMRRNPLSSAAGLALRERYRSMLVPLCQLALMLCALVTRSTPLLMIALLVPALFPADELQPFTLRSAVDRLVRLPFRGAIAGYAAFMGLFARLRHDSPPPRSADLWPKLELWSQCAAAAVCASLALAQLPVWVPGLLAAAAFSCFPLLNRQKVDEDAEAALSSAERQELAEIAGATWHFLKEQADASPLHIPADVVQTSPPTSSPATYSPESAGLYLCAAVAARELSFISVSEAAHRIEAALSTLEALPRPLSLPFRAYSADGMPAETQVDTRACGLLLVALMTAAQALRSWLPELPARFHPLPARLDAYALSLDVKRLYDRDTGLFCESLDENGAGSSLCAFLRDESTLLSVAACARGDIPPEHFRRLSRTRTAAGGGSQPLSVHGDARASLLAGLFLPIDRDDALAAIHLMQQRGMRGLWARARCAAYAFTPSLTYRVCDSGLHEIAAGDPHPGSVFAPYAAALALPFAPQAALNSLRAMRQLGAFGASGFCDSVTLSPDGRADLALTHRAAHQALLLSACAHVLCDAPLQRFFCALPPVEAALPLLHMTDARPLTLPPRPPYGSIPARPPRPDRQVSAGVPGTAQLLGSRDAQIAVNAAGSSRMRFRRQAAHDFTGAAGLLEGLQIYLVLDGQPFCLTDPTLPGDTVFSPSRVQFTRLCGCVRTTLTIFSDLTAGRIMHLLELTNLSTQEASVELADCLLVSQMGRADTLEASAPSMEHLFLRERGGAFRLHHRFAASCAIADSLVCTDALAFLGAGRTLRRPASLERPMQEQPFHRAASCLSFRFSLRLSGRGHSMALFSTSAEDRPLPHWEELEGLMELAALQSEAVADAADITPHEALLADLLTPRLIWRSFPASCASAIPDGAPLPAAEAPHIAIELSDISGPAPFRELLGAATCLHMRGEPVSICALCAGRAAEAARADVASRLPDGAIPPRIMDEPSPELRNAILRSARIVLHGGSRTLLQQLEDAEAATHRPNTSFLSPEPGRLPDAALTHESSYGGLDPDTGDYLVRLNVGQLPPADWRSTVRCGSFSFGASVSGLTAPFSESVLLHVGAHPPFDPLGDGLPRAIRFGQRCVQWQSFAADFRIDIRTCPMPGADAALRTLRIVSTSGDPLHVRIVVSALLTDDDSPLEPGDDHVSAPLDQQRFIAAGTGIWHASLVPTLSLLECPGTARSAAQLEATLDIAPYGSMDIAWLAGHRCSPEDIAAMQAHLQEHGSSRVYRDNLARCTVAGSELTVSTPDPYFDLLLNHLLPRQMLGAMPKPAQLLPVLLLSDSASAADTLRTRFATETDAARRLHLCAAYCLLLRDGLSGDLPEDMRSFMMDSAEECVASARPLLHLFVTAAAAGLLAAQDAALRELHHRLLNHADVHLWHGDHYGTNDQITLDVQSWAALASGSSYRTQRALHACRERLCEPSQGLIRQQLPDPEACEIPGTRRNGGQDTLSAVWYAAALLHTGDKAHAREIIRTVNPLHHTDTHNGAETFHAAPWIIPESIEAAPASTGRASMTPGNEAALWLYAVLLRSVLGFRRQGAVMQLQPMVPDDWDDFSATLRLGESTWHFEFSRGLNTRYLDGRSLKPDEPIPCEDDGRIHQVRIPL